MNLKNPTTVMVAVTFSIWNYRDDCYTGLSSQVIQVLLYAGTEEERAGELVAKMSKMVDAFCSQGVTISWAEVPGWIQ